MGQVKSVMSVGIRLLKQRLFLSYFLSMKVFVCYTCCVSKSPLSSIKLLCHGHFPVLRSVKEMQKVACCADVARLLAREAFIPAHIIAHWPFFIHSPISVPCQVPSWSSQSIQFHSTLRSICLTPAVRFCVSGLSRLKQRETGGYNEQIKQREGEEDNKDDRGKWSTSFSCVSRDIPKRSLLNSLRRCLFCFWPASLFLNIVVL